MVLTSTIYVRRLLVHLSYEGTKVWRLLYASLIKIIDPEMEFETMTDSNILFHIGKNVTEFNLSETPITKMDLSYSVSMFISFVLSIPLYGICLRENTFDIKEIFV